ncbi:membrane fusion protein (multidrug efflux system) [Oceanibaculum indicum]|uniref:Membrane fusion protein (Multidrug efflux system) n=2 Tax=Oceanibaculum indicum TaxID=526216 RepID=A0A420WRI6_9PROT|nr:membrane fusion protein (multidrug efflux system) [Oceanibaculum indicum]
MQGTLGRSFRLFTIAAGMVALGLSVAACEEQKQANGGAQAAPPPPEVLLTTVETRDIPVSYEYAGRVTGSREVEVRARVSGILMERTYTEGEKVKQGDLLFLIDPAPYEAALAQAEAMLQQQQASLAQAEREWKRISSLFERNAVSARERDSALSTLELAKATVAGARAELRTARINLDYTRVEAPISGVTSLEAVSEGSLVGTGQDSSLLTRISQLDPVYVNFAVPDAESLQLRNMRESGALTQPADGRLRVDLRLSDGSIVADAGYVDFTDSTIDPNTGTIRNRAVVANPGSDLMPGQFVRVMVNGMVLRDAVTVPQAAVLQGPQGMMVYVVDGENTATPRPIKIGRAIEDSWLVRDGLKTGDRVIVEGVIKVRPGQKVRPAEPKQGDQKPGGQKQAQAGNR